MKHSRYAFLFPILLVAILLAAISTLAHAQETTRLCVDFQDWAEREGVEEIFTKDGFMFTSPDNYWMSVKQISGDPVLYGLYLAAEEIQIDFPQAASAQTTVTLIPVADASVEFAQPDTKFGVGDTLNVYYKGENEYARALIRFNLAAELPDKAIIDRARLELFLDEYEDGPDFINLVAALLTEDWIESTVTWKNRPPIEPSEVTTLVDTTVSPITVDVTEIVRAWHSVPHYGLELRGPEGETFYYFSFWSREHGENLPQLVVTYHLPLPLPPPPAYTFTGHVYQGYPPDTSMPIGGVTIELYGDEDEWPDAEFERVLLTSTSTNHAGEFTLVWEPGDLSYPYFHVIEVDPPGTYSTGAQAEPPGYVKNLNVVSYLDIPPGTYNGSTFWDQLPEEPKPPDMLVPILGGVAVALAGGLVTWQIRKRLRHRKWQEEAEENPQEPCESGTKCCQKIEGKYELSQCRIKYLRLTAFNAVSGKLSEEKQVRGKIVDGLNMVIAASRRGEKPEKLRKQMMPLAQALLQSIMDWLYKKRSPQNVSITGHLEGCKVTYKFKLKECKETHTWGEAKEAWDVTIKEERDEPLSVLQRLESTIGISEQLTTELTGRLTRFIEKV